jgi:hypothetical protein
LGIEKECVVFCGIEPVGAPGRYKDLLAVQVGEPDTGPLAEGLRALAHVHYHVEQGTLDTGAELVEVSNMQATNDMFVGIGDVHLRNVWQVGVITNGREYFLEVASVVVVSVEINDIGTFDLGNGGCLHLIIK